MKSLLKADGEDNLLIAKASVIFTAIILLLSGLIRVWLAIKRKQKQISDTGTHGFPYQVFTTAMDLMNQQKK